jgi:hypothetical protein
MLDILADVLAQYETGLVRYSVPLPHHGSYRKWLRYYLDFCAKHHPPDSRQERVRLFLAKLQEKNQTPAQQKQAAHAVALYFALLRGPEKVAETLGESNLPPQRKQVQPIAPLPARGSTSADSPRGSLKSQSLTSLQALRLRSGSTPRSNLDGKNGGNEIASSPGPVRSPVEGASRNDSFHPLLRQPLRGKGAPVGPTEWEKVAQRLAEEIKTRHYSAKTLKAYALWAAKFRSFIGDKTPASVSAAEVKAYLTYLAVKCKVSASTQNQAFNALLFLFRHVRLKLSQLCSPSLAGQL